MAILRKELNELAIQWNKHNISKSKSSTMPAGKPNTLYFCPELVGGIPCKKDVDSTEIDEFDDPIFIVQAPDNSHEFIEFAETVMDSYGMEIPENFSEALELYFVLLGAIDDHL